MMGNWARLLEPIEENPIIWRYMSFAKFMSILQYNQIFFTRSDMFKDDPFEGIMTVRYRRERREGFERFKNSDPINLGKFPDWAESHDYRHEKHVRKSTFISCWHMNAEENYAMWKVYVQGFEGVAIKSDYLRLRKSLNNEESIIIGKVNYIDPNDEVVPDEHGVFQFLHKRPYFQYENELRAIYFDRAYNYLEEPRDISGDMIAVDIEMLVDAIYISPWAGEWFKDLVKTVLDKYGFSHKSVYLSRLEEKPHSI
ncbi:MAG: hypothetical protein ACXVP2_03870 [Tumebacillaceae bacterium]